VHLSAEHVEALFGPGHALKVRNELSQPGQFAAEETVVVAGPKGALERVRVLGPARGKTQVELAGSDGRALGIDAPVRDSGDIAGSAGAVLIGPAGAVTLREGVIIAARHLHAAPLDARHLGLSDGEEVAVAVGTGRRPVVFGGVTVRVSESYRLELHLDTDEANSAGCSHGDTAWVLAGPVGAAVSGFRSNGEVAGGAGLGKAQPGPGSARGPGPGDPAARPTSSPMPGAVDLSSKALITEEDVLAAAQSGRGIIIGASAIVTPLARDAARQRGVELMAR
jgi:putative phosphotransacetylase